MTKYEWTKRHIEVATKDHPPGNRKYMDAFLAEVKKAGQSLTRLKFFEIYEAGRPSNDVEFDYFNYTVLEDHWPAADFSEAWDLPEVEPLPRITTTAKFGKRTLPSNFCSLGGTPDWIQNERYPICPKCDADMLLFLQLKSLPYELVEKNEGLGAFMFGDAGNFYLFHCPKCGTHKTSWQCH